MIPTSRFDFASRPHRRALTVWASFVATMTVLGGVLLLTDQGPLPRLGSSQPALGVNLGARAIGSVLDTAAPLKQDQWLEIVIHDSGSQHGSVESLARQARSLGLKGLGYHFVIGNGNGMGDGELHVGYRWNEQLAGAHVAGPDAAWHNVHSVAICLVGNGEASQFTDRQMARLVDLVRGLQERLNIDLDHVLLNSAITGQSSPGRHFPEQRFRDQLRLNG
ncbi:MAG: N-acetylmuramoyl-L-alanine amidase [Phycisphaerales bacterium]|nr:N-acetylmuramoyl-L-alanine amidase [Phycisphaerales bacterium]